MVPPQRRAGSRQRPGRIAVAGGVGAGAVAYGAGVRLFKAILRTLIFKLPCEDVPNPLLARKGLAALACPAWSRRRRPIAAIRFTVTELYEAVPSKMGPHTERIRAALGRQMQNEVTGLCTDWPVPHRARNARKNALARKPDPTAPSAARAATLQGARRSPPALNRWTTRGGASPGRRR